VRQAIDGGNKVRCAALMVKGGVLVRALIDQRGDQFVRVTAQPGAAVNGGGHVEADAHQNWNRSL
jgi:hypothetical protein